MEILELLRDVLIRNGLVTAFAFIGLVIWLSYLVSARLTGGRVHGSAIAILAGLALAWWGGVVTGGERGVADLPILAGVGILGGAMLRDFAIVATAFGVRFDEIRSAGIGAALSLLAGVFVSFVVGAAVAWGFGYRDSVSMTTIGAGAATYIVGPVTGTAVLASVDGDGHHRTGKLILEDVNRFAVPAGNVAVQGLHQRDAPAVSAGTSR